MKPTMSHPKVKVPPLSFACVNPGLYRSAHPMPVNFSFIDSLHLKTIIYLSTDEYLPDNIEWAKRNGVQVVCIKMDQCSDQSIWDDYSCVNQAIQVLLDKSNYPILCHSNKGKHKVGVVMGCLRKLQGWSLSSIFAEYDRYSGGKGLADLEFIEMYNPSIESENLPEWIARKN